MKVAIIGSRNLVVSDLQRYLPDDVTEIISGEQSTLTAAQEVMHVRIK